MNDRVRPVYPAGSLPGPGALEGRPSGASPGGPLDPYRVYEPSECGPDGYPYAWHSEIKYGVRRRDDHRCLRCGHPYLVGENPLVKEFDEEGNDVWASWSPCDERCTHTGPVRIRTLDGSLPDQYVGDDGVPYRAGFVRESLLPELVAVEARWRILTVHHLDGVKANCRWWNLVSLCQRCHLRTQRVVQMDRVWPWEHSEWFKPFVAAFYALRYEGREITREEAEARLDELLAYERIA